MEESILVYDIEANGLLEESTKVHCIVAKEIGNPMIYKLWNNTSLMHLAKTSTETHLYLDADTLYDLFSKYNKVVCHNQISFDIPMLKKFYDVDLDSIIESDNIIDTFVWSQVLNPDRLIPKGCPTTIIPPPELRAEGFKSKKIGPHGLDSWGYRVGRKKPAIHDWRFFTPGILNRCVEDVLINEGAYLMLLKEAGL